MPVTPPLRQAGIRQHNLTLALQLVAAAVQPVSRAQIAASTGLTRATASTLVDRLVTAGLVREVTLPPTARSGRPASGLVLAPDGPAGVGVEVNVDYVATTVVDLTGAVVFREVRADDLASRTPRAAMTRVARAAGAALDAAAALGLVVAGVEVALPGLLDAARGRLLLAPNLGWRDVDVVGLLRRDQRLADLTMSVGNEADFAALGELSSLGPRGPHSFVHVSGEVGVGAGIVLEGRLHRGLHGWSGEIGHVTVDRSGPQCGCGARGCLEQYAGQDAIARAAGLAPGHGTVLGGQRTLPALVSAADLGTPAVLAALDDAAQALGVVLAGVVNVLGLDTVVLGGSYAPLAAWLIPPVERELASRVLWSDWAPVTVRAANAGPEAAVIGAARSVIARLLENPGAWQRRATS